MSDFDTDVMEIRPRLLFDVQFHKETDGVSFSRRNELFKVDGLESYRAMMQVIPHLTGERTLGEICARLEPESVEATVGLVQLLSAQGFVVPCHAEVSELAEPVRQRFAPQIEFISQFTEQPLKRFEQFRNSRLLVAGSGAPARALVLALARNGARGALCDGQLPVRALQRDCESVSPGFQIETIVPNAELSRENAKPDVLCYASDTPDLAAIAQLSAACARGRIPFIPGMMLTGKAFVGPLSSSSNRPCWFCLFMRRSENVPPKQSASMWQSLALGKSPREHGDSQVSPGSQILGNLVAFEAFKLLAKHLPLEIEDHVVTFDLESLECGKSRLLPHPACPRCASASCEEDLSYLLMAAASNEEARRPIPARLQQVSVLMNADLGILTGANDDGLPQSPLFQASLRFRSRDSGEERSAFGYSLHSYGDARLKATCDVVRTYSASLALESRIWRGSAADAERTGLRVISGSQLTACLAVAGVNSHCTEWIHAVSSETQEPCLVPAAAVYNCSSLNRSAFESSLAGVGVGYWFKDACRDAIESALVHESLKQLALGRQFATLPAIASLLHASPDLQLVVTILDTLGVEFRVITVTHAGLTCAIAFSPGTTADLSRIAVGAHARVANAIAGALTDLVAIVGGGKPRRTLEHYLPSSLGYCIDICELERCCESVHETVDRQRPEILIANLAMDDIDLADLSVVKALVLRPTPE